MLCGLIQILRQKYRRMRVFIANDETKKNTYGFKTLTAGIDLAERFNDNPVCLNNHSNTTKDVLGSWKDVKKEGGLLLMSPDFDTQDPDGVEVVRKVNADKIKACSMGIIFDPKDLVYRDGELILLKCVLFEVSIVAVPSNANSITLYSQEGNPLSDEEIKTLCLKAQTYILEPKINRMDIVKAYLQLETAVGEAEVLTAIRGIEAKLTASETEKENLKIQLSAYQNKENERLATLFKEELTAAIKDGRIDAKQEEHFKTLSAETAISILQGLPKRETVAVQVKDENKKVEKYAKMSWTELDKGNHLAKLKAENFDLYAEKYEEHFGKAPQNNQ